MLQEQANELGFETVQEALDNDYDIVGDQLVYNAAKGLESAHRAWEKEKEEKLSILQSVKEEIINDYGTDCALVGDLEDVYDWIEKEAHE